MGKMTKSRLAGVLLAGLLCGCVARPPSDGGAKGFAPPPMGFLKIGAHDSGRTVCVERAMPQPTRLASPVASSGGFSAPVKKVPVSAGMPPPSQALAPPRPTGKVYMFADVEFDVRQGTGMVWVVIDGYRQQLPEGRTVVSGRAYGRGRVVPKVRFKVIDGKGRSLADGVLAAGARRTVVVVSGEGTSVPPLLALVSTVPAAMPSNVRPMASSTTTASLARPPVAPVVQQPANERPEAPSHAELSHASPPEVPVAVPANDRPVALPPADIPLAPPPALPVVVPSIEQPAASLPMGAAPVLLPEDDVVPSAPPLPDRGYLCFFNELAFVHQVYTTGSRAGRRELLPGSLAKKLRMYSIEQMSWVELAERLHRLRRQTELTEEQFAFFKPYWPVL